MPPKTKKKRASLKLDTASGQIQDSEESNAEEKSPSVRQVVEVVEEGNVPEAIETIKKDAEEIEEAVETIEDEVKEVQPSEHEEVEAEPKGDVESLFVKSESGVSPEITVVGKKRTPLGVWVGAMLGVALAIGVSLIVLVKGPPTLPFFGTKPTPTPAPTVVPTPTVSALNRADIKVSVVNGGGTPGAGGKMKTFLEDKGYTVVSVGNAEEYSYEQTEVLAKTGKTDIVALLTEDLKADYSMGTSSATVEDTADFDAQVIVGKEE
ncbi:MAG TPA: LytR C-terminal domain-containing protein [Patescibacteria group bacterium]|nr:LytR C-terminal domain-containing protein [Patescibacteria group bacterium]